jgi:hypothetical protein
MPFLKAHNVRGLAKKNDWPSYTEEEPKIYEQEELDQLFAVCDEEERLWYEFFLMTGMREQDARAPVVSLSEQAAVVNTVEAG